MINMFTEQEHNNHLFKYFTEQRQMTIEKNYTIQPVL